MIGLVKKDILMAKSNLKVLLVIFIVFGLMSLNGNDNSYFTFIPAFLSIVIMMSTFSYDEFNKSNQYISALPNGRKNYVLAKYISTLLIVFISLFLTSILLISFRALNNSLNFGDIIELLVGCSVGIILVIAFIYPFIYKFGIEKSRIIIFIIAFGFTGLGSVLMKVNIPFVIPEVVINFINNYYMIVFPLVTLLLLFISYKISEMIYLKKEL